MFNSEAITKIQSVILICVIVVAAVGGTLAYVLLNGEATSETIKIGLLADLDAPNGKHAWQGSILAVEHLNAGGGILGRQVELFCEDDDSETSPDMTLTSSALTRLIAYHEVDFITGGATGEAAFVCQGIVSEHKKIFINGAGPIPDALAQTVLDDYSKYKYSFFTSFNMSATFEGVIDSLVVFKENTGFKKIGIIGEDLAWATGIMEGLDVFLPAYGFEIVYRGTFPVDTVDFSSYFAQAEAAGVDILVPAIGVGNGVSFVKEYYDRQSPMIVYSGVNSGASVPESWDFTDGKCEHMSVSMLPIAAEYPITTKTMGLRETYFDRWGVSPSGTAAGAYDIIRYIFVDAIERAGTIETEAVISALEDTSVETTLAINFVFTESHCAMMGENPNDPDADYPFVMIFQWQANGELVPVYPKKIMERAGATYTFPDWPGPWD